MYSNKFLKKQSRKKLYSLVKDLEMQYFKKASELYIEKHTHEINKTALSSAESALDYKEKQIEHKDRLLNSLINS